MLQVSQPENGKDVRVKLMVRSKNTVAMPLSVNISVQAMSHKGTPVTNIQRELMEETLQPGEGGALRVLDHSSRSACREHVG